MKKLFLLRYLALIALLILVFQENVFSSPPYDNDKSNVIYVDVKIYQPNIEFCYDNTSVLEYSQQNWFKVFPNPSEGVFNLEINDVNYDKNINIFVFNSAGVRVYHSLHESIEGYLSLEINLSGLPKGIYSIRTQTTTKSGVKKLILY